MPIERRLYVFMIGFSVFGVVLSYFAKIEPGWIARVSSLLTLGLGVYSVVRLFEPKWALAWVAMLGLSVEVLGIYTSIPFGPYRYTAEWWPVVPLPGGQVFPIQLPAAWVLVTGSCFVLTSFVQSTWIRVFLTALFATACDVIMEPVVSGKLRYWEWLGSSPLPYKIPWENFAGWFATSLIAGAIYMRLAPQADNRKGAGLVLGLYLGLMAVIFVFWRTS